MPNAELKKPLEIFRAGTFTATDGKQHTFTREMLADLVANYSAERGSAPFVVGHPTIDAPAYGWVKSLQLKGDVLLAEPADVEAQFAGMVNEKRFPRISSAIFLPDAPGNPTPGKPYLKHVGFLGAAAPAVPGLKTAAFSGSTEGVAEFSTWADRGVISIFRNFRDWLISKYDIATADQIVPSYQLDAMTEQVVQGESADGDLAVSAFASPTRTNNSPEIEMQQVQTAEALAAREAANNAKEADLAAREARIKANEHAARVAAFAAFTEALVTEGKLLPAKKAVVIEVLSQLDAGGGVASFAQGDENHGKTGVQLLQDLLQAQPKIVTFGEIATGRDENTGAANFAAPAGYEVDPERAALHNKALAYATQHKVDYITAVKAVGA